MEHLAKVSAQSHALAGSLEKYCTVIKHFSAQHFFSDMYTEVRPRFGPEAWCDNGEIVQSGVHNVHRTCLRVGNVICVVCARFCGLTLEN